jgi:hypothetical protein
MPNLEGLNDEWDIFATDFNEFAQGPSDFQIEVFMGRGEGPPELLPVHAYRHMLAQIKPAISEMRRLKIDEVRITRKLASIRQKVDSMTEMDLLENPLDLDLIQLNLDLEENQLSQKGKRTQYETMKKILVHLKTTYGEMTNDRLQADEPTYWLVRLAKQMIDAAEGNMTGVGSGNINSLRNAVNGSILPNSHNVLPILPFNSEVLKDIANGSKDTIEKILFHDKQLRQQLSTENRTIPALVVPNQPEANAPK